jgi:hypothetical protein
MKRLIGIIMAVIALASVGQAANNVGIGVPKTTTGVQATSTGLAASTNYVLDVTNPLFTGAVAGDILAAQLNVASATFATATFKDGAQSTGSITVVSTTSLVGVAGSDTLTVSTNSALVLSTGSATIGIFSISGLTGSSITLTTHRLHGFVAGTDFVVGASTNATAINLAAAVNYATPVLRAAVSPVGGSTVTLTCVNPGSTCNGYTMVSSTTGMKASAFTGGTNNPSFTVNGLTLTQGAQWFTDVNYSSNTPVSIKNAINLSVPNVTASTTSATVVTLTCTTQGANCNAYTLTSSTAALAVGGATFSAGQNAAVIAIGPYFLTQGTTQGPGVWAIGSNTSNTAINISSCIVNTPGLKDVVVSTTIGGGSIVFATSTFDGSQYNYALAVSTQALTVSGPAMAGGIDPAYSANGKAITLPATPFTTGLQVLYSTGSGSGITGLTYGTTYFIGVVDSSHVSLGTSLANVQAGTFATLASTRAATSANSFTLAPLPITGTASFIWQSSDDNVNFSNITSNFYGISVSSASLPSPYTAASFVWDMGEYRHRYLNLKATPPTTGAAAFTLYMNVKSASK